MNYLDSETYKKVAGFWNIYNLSKTMTTQHFRPFIYCHIDPLSSIKYAYPHIHFYFFITKEEMVTRDVIG